MKNQDISKKLKAISEAMNKNIIRAWEDDMGNATDAVALENHGDVEYNGWSDELEALIKSLEEQKEPTKMEVMVGEFMKYIAVDNATHEEIVTEIEHLQKYLCKDESLDHILSDHFTPCASFEHDFTVQSFLDQIDIKGYESN